MFRLTNFIFFILFPSLVFANTIKVEITKNDSFNPQILHLNIGDEVEWIPVGNGHNVEFLAVPEEVLIPIKSRINEIFLYKFNVPGIYFYGCTPHMEMGMVGLIIVGKNYHNLEDIKKIQISNVTNGVLKKLLNLISK